VCLARGQASAWTFINPRSEQPLPEGVGQKWSNTTRSITTHAHDTAKVVAGRTLCSSRGSNQSRSHPAAGAPTAWLKVPCFVAQ